MADNWLAGDDVKNTMRDLVAKYHPHLATCVDEIAVLFNDKATKVGDVVVAGKTAKASPLFSVLAEVPWKFIITLAADAWGELDDKQRLALLDHHLCACGAKEEEGGGMSYYVAQPDVAFFKEEVQRHGVWRTSGAAPTQDLINDLFGEDTP
ncbi:MAG: putative metallopeptidase [Bacteroidota bacterium]|jgi:hypothetical protein